MRSLTSAGSVAIESASVIEERDFADPLRDHLVRVAEAGRERLEPLGLLERREVFALQVLDESDLGDRPVVDVHLDAGHLLEPHLKARAVAPLARDDHEAAADLGRADEDRLEHTDRADRVDEIGEVADLDARLAGFGSSRSMGIIRPIGAPELCAASCST